MGGHPKGLTTLFFTEFWERFSYYGMRAILTLFMVASVADGGLGLDVATAAAIYGFYTAAVFFMGIPGGWIADRLLGQRNAGEHGIALAQEPVGDPASRNAHEENRGGVEAVDRGCRGDVESESPIRHAGNHEQREDRPHSVVAESLPELGEEKRRQAFRVSAHSAGAAFLSLVASLELRPRFPLR